MLQHCLARISQEVEAAAAQGVAVRYPIGGCSNKVLRLLVDDAAILNSRDKVCVDMCTAQQHHQTCVPEWGNWVWPSVAG